VVLAGCAASTRWLRRPGKTRSGRAAPLLNSKTGSWRQLHTRQFCVSGMLLCFDPKTFLLLIGKQKQPRIELRRSRRQHSQWLVELALHSVRKFILYRADKDHFFPGYRYSEFYFIGRTALRISYKPLVLHIERAGRHFLR